jgi:hypothetical protein
MLNTKWFSDSMIGNLTSILSLKKGEDEIVESENHFGSTTH